MNRATAAWLASRGLRSESSEWRVTIDLENDAQAPTARFNIAIAIPNLEQLGVLVTGLERRFDLYFRRLHARSETTIDRSEPAIRLWVVACV
ncbi:MAG: hypothetical protein ABJE66_31785 [Deltaproteobacteria bacterium]